MRSISRHRVDLAPICLSGIETLDIVSDRTFPRHAHDQFGIGIMHAGGHASWSGLGPVEAGPGDVVAVNPEEMHDGAPVRDARAWRMVYLEPVAVARLVGTEAARREIGFAVRSDRRLAPDVARAIAILRAGEAAAAEEALTGLLADLLLPSHATGDRMTSPATARAVARILDAPDAPPSLDEIAAIMGMERTGALRRFRREVGATPHDYAMQMRLRLARRALTAGEAPAVVATDLGFADQSHLTRAFSRQFGLPPGRYQAARTNIVQDDGSVPPA
jgi:AraC-like DNA-binding protein